MCSFCLALSSHSNTGFMEEILVPSCSERGPTGEAGCSYAIEKFRAADAIGAV